MMVSMDKAGRIVIPHTVREGLSLVVGAEFEVIVDTDEIRLVPMRQQRRLVMADDGLPVVERVSQQVTDADVQRWRDADQR